MAKQFTARVSKRNRSKIDLTSKLDQKIFEMSDDKLLKGAQLDNIELKKINVRKQVRTKFNDSSIKELADNIKENGLIQPLVVHREGSMYVLICGERRFRAMSTLKDMTHAPCFILENKTDEELMAIQFSENSAREQLHYIDQADSIFGYKKLTGASERKIQAALGISKSEVHRCLLIAALPKRMKEAAKEFNIEKYVLLEWNQLGTSRFKTTLKNEIIKGNIKKRTELKRRINAADANGTKATTARKASATTAAKKTTTRKRTAKKDDEMLKVLTEMKLTKKQKEALNKLLQ